MTFVVYKLLLIRPEPIMLFNLPIMLLSNAPIFFLLCPNYAPLKDVWQLTNHHCSHVHVTYYHFIHCYLNQKILFL